MCQCTPGIKTPFCGKPGCELPPQKVREDEDIAAAAKSLSAMIIEWVDEGRRMEISDWRPGLPGIIKSRLRRFWPELPLPSVEAAMAYASGYSRGLKDCANADAAALIGERDALSGRLAAEKALSSHYRAMMQIAEGKSPSLSGETISRMQREMGERCPRKRGDDCVYPECDCDRPV